MRLRKVINTFGVSAVTQFSEDSRRKVVVVEEQAVNLVTG